MKGINCPNKNLPEWKELVEVVGENQAHYLWDLNNGHSLDETPDGKPSKLFSDLLSHYNGDRNAAILAKAKVYSEAFKNWFGDWINRNSPIENPYIKNISIELDIDRESVDADGYGSLVNIKLEDNIIGSIPMQLQIGSVSDFKFTPYVDVNSVAGASYIEEEYRGKGYGKAAYFELGKWLHRNGSTLRSAPDNSRTEAATRVWKSLERDGFAKKVGNRYEFIYNNVSKVVDENGEPLIVYHHANEEFSEFSIEFDNYFSTIKNGTKKALFFTGTANPASGTVLDRPYRMPVFLNAKNVIQKTGTKKLLREQGEGFVATVNRAAEEADVAIFHGIDDNLELNLDIYVINNPNNVKSIDNQGTFSTQNNNIYLNQSNEPDTKKLLIERCKGLLHEYGKNKGLYLNKTLYYDHINERAIPKGFAELTRIFSLANIQANLLGFELVPSIEGNLESRLLLRPLSLRDLLEQSTDLVVDSEVKKVLDFLSDRFPGLTVRTVPAELAEDGVNAWIDGNEIYLVEGRYNKEIAIEEAIHPFINTLFNTNRELFDSLYNEISIKYPKLKALIERRYANKDADTRKQELVALAFSRAFNEEFSNNKPSKLKQVLLQFIDWVRSLFTDNVVHTYEHWYNEPMYYVSTSELPKMSLSELVKLIHTNDTRFDVIFDGTFNSLSEPQIREVNKTYERIQLGLKDRLKSVKRYSTKNPKLWRLLSTVINQLSNSEAEQGILQFLLHVSDTIGEASKFLQRPIEDINAKLIRLLSLDYVGFYKPLLDEIQYLADTTDIFKDLPNYNDLLANIQTLSTKMNQIYNRFNNVLKAKGKSELQAYLTENGMPQEYIDLAMQWLDNPTVDSAIFLNWFGMASNSNNAVLQAIAKLLNDTMNATERETMSKGTELVKLVQVAKEKYGIDVLKLLYEKFKDGTYSGYMVKPINYGLYRKDKLEYLDKLAAKLGIKKDQDGYYDVPTDDEIQLKWIEGVNEFYSKRVNRRFVLEYYKKRNQYLSVKTRLAIDEILDYIDSITSSVTRDGVVYENELTASEYELLVQLRKLKRLLANPYNLDGSLKTGTDGQIAEELRKFNDAIGSQDYVIDWNRYNKDLTKVIKRYGSKDDPRVQAWIARNTRTRYTLEFYDRLDRLNKVELNQQYKDLVEKRRQLRLLFSDPHTGLIAAEKLSDSERELLLQLDKDIEASKTHVQASNPVEDDKFRLFAEIEYTAEYYDDYKRALQVGAQAFNDWYWKNHYENSYGQIVPASYYTQLKPKDMNQYSETVPTGRYSTVDASSVWYNKDFDTTGPAILPKKEFYDNSKAYNEVMNKPEVKALYEAIETTMQEANSFISFLNNLDDGRMPLIPARFMQVMNRMSGIMLRLGYVWDEFATTQPDDMDFVEEFSTMPNGDPIKVIPTRFIKMLDNTNAISTDAVSAVIAYYHMATNFKNMQQNQDLIELLLNLLRNVQVHNRRGVKPAGSTNIYKLALLLVDRLMYGRNMTPIAYKVGNKEINVSKIANNILNFVRKVNLSGNIWSIATSFFTDSTYTTMEAALGRFFDKNDLAFAISEFLKQLPSFMSNIGNPIPKGKLAYLMLLNQVVKDNQEIFNRLDQSQILRSINQNFWYAGYTLSDYVVKSHTLLAIYHDYRFVDGKFLSKNEFLNQYYPNDRKAGEVAFKQLKTTLYDAYNEDGTVKEQYEKAVTTQLLNKVKNRIDVLSRRIDGTLREVDKAAVHAHALALYIVLHKNFMISGLHDRFKKKQFNLDTGVEEEGYYRSMADFLKGIVGNKHFALKQILADYDQLNEYELYAVRRVLYDMILITASTSLALAIATIVDGDDDYDNWFMLSLTYLALRSAFEFRTMYNPFEFISMIKSPTAAFTWFDNASSFINLFNPFSYIGKGGPFSIIDRGVYEGMPRIIRNMIKVTPVRSIIEAADPESKRSYLLNQLMTF